MPGTGNQFVDRLVLFITHPNDHPDTIYTRNVSVWKMHLSVFTFLSPADCKQELKRLYDVDGSVTIYALGRYGFRYTAIQTVCLLACWGMRFTGPVAIAFPLVIVLFVPLRLRVLPRFV